MKGEPNSCQYPLFQGALNLNKCEKFPNELATFNRGGQFLIQLCLKVDHGAIKPVLTHVVQESLVNHQNLLEQVCLPLVHAQEQRKDLQLLALATVEDLPFGVIGQDDISGKEYLSGEIEVIHSVSI